ncbi:MAG: hypothetical protein AAB544_01655 [Patescibacteria group bacterium]
MKNPEIPKEQQEPSREALKDLHSAVKLSPEAVKERDQMVDVVADTRGERAMLVEAMKLEKNIPKADLRKLEMVLTA